MPNTDASRDSGSGTQPVTGAQPQQLQVAPEDVKPYGRYLLFRKIAEGGMAEIFLAKKLGEKGFERDVVIKRMLGHLSQQPEFFDMFQDEARIAAKLGHPNIVQIDDFGQIDGRYFICMEYLPGEDFSSVVRTASKRREYVPVHIAVRVIIEAARGLAHAHEFADDAGKSLNIVHRDISPSNIFVTYAGQVKVLDFGIAKAESRSTSTTAGVVKGKYMYMAPEQARGLDVDRRADVFSLGVSLFEALTNTRPFAKDNDLAILNAVLKGDFSQPRALRPELPVELEQIVVKAMHPDRDQRHQSAAEFAADLERFLGASTSASGGMQVAAYLKSLFPEDRVSMRSKIPSLQKIAATGAQIPGFTDPHLTPARPAGSESRRVAVDSEGRTAVVKSDVITPRNGTGKSVLLGVALTLAVVGVSAGAAVVWMKDQQRQAQVTPPAVEQKQTAEMVQVPKDVAAPAPEPVQVAAVTPPPVVEPVVAKQQTPPAPVKARTTAKTGPLSAAEIAKVVSSRKALMLSCFEKNKMELGAEAGVTNVQFAVASTGRVTDVAVQGALADAKAGLCLRQQFTALKFRKHPDQEVRLMLPFKWSIQR